MLKVQDTFHERLLQGLCADLQAEEVLDQIVHTVTEHLGADGGFLYLKDRQTGQLVLRSASVNEPHSFLRSHVGTLRLEPGDGLTGWALENHQTGLINSNLQDDLRFCYTPSLGEDDFNSAVAVPIYLPDGRSIGVLTLYSCQEESFGVTSVSAAEEVVGILAGIIDRAELAASDRRKADVLAFLSDLATSLNREISAREVLSDVARKTCSILNASYCVIVFFDEEHHIIVQASAGESVRDANESSAFAGEVVLREMPVGENEQVVFDSILKTASSESSISNGEIISSPLNAGLQQIGVINCHTDTLFSFEDQSLLETISAQVALSLKSALLMQNLRDVDPVWRLVKLLANRSLAPEASAIASMLGVDIKRPHVVIRGRMTRTSQSGNDGTSSIDASMKEVENLIKAQCPGSLVHFDFGELTAIVRVKGDASIGAVADRLDTLCVDIRKKWKVHLTIGISTLVSAASQYSNAFEEALEALKVGATSLGHGRAFTYQRVALHIYMHRIAADTRVHDDPLRQKFVPLFRYDQQKRTQFLSTLRIYLDNHGNTAETCRSLRIHRNTLRQRLTRIEELIGINLNDKENWFAYKMGIELVQMLPDYSGASDN